VNEDFTMAIVNRFRKLIQIHIVLECMTAVTDRPK